MKIRENKRMRELWLDHYAKDMQAQAKEEGLLAYKAASMTPFELYDFLDRASSRQLVQKIEFQEYVLNALGEIEDDGLPCMTWVFLHVRMYVRDILAEGEQAWPLPHFESEIREMARLQALAGWR